MAARRRVTSNEWVDPDDAPELSDDMLDRADLMEGDKVVRRGRRGRPKLDAPKEQITLRLDPDVIKRFRAGGPGWQSRINAALRRHLERVK